MKKNKKIIVIVAVAICAVVAVTGVAYAWFVTYKTGAYLITGDTKISVNGFYQIADPTDELTYRDTLLSVNPSNDLSPNQFIAYKFEIKNETAHQCTVSLGFGDFSEYIFDNFTAYRAEYGALTENTENTIQSSAESNAAKLTLQIEDCYCVSNGSAVRLAEDATDKYLWKYSCGEKFLSDIPLAASASVTVYFKISNKQSSTSVSEYKDWLCGTAENVGYGQTRCANILGYSYSALPSDDKAITDDYLAYFCRKEFDTFNSDNNTFSSLDIHLNYFEFVADSVATLT
jgi:hypothetical protein